jgi:hypothetical protein
MRRLHARRTAGVGAFSSVGGLLASNWQSSADLDSGLPASAEGLCAHCGKAFKPGRRPDGDYCSQDCEAAMQGQCGGSWALITWTTHGDFTSRFRFFPTRAAAQAAAPADAPYTVIDRTVKPRRERLSIDEVLKAVLGSPRMPRQPATAQRVSRHPL